MRLTCKFRVEYPYSRNERNTGCSNPFQQSSGLSEPALKFLKLNGIIQYVLKCRDLIRKLPIDILHIIMTYNHLCRKHLCSSVKTKTWKSLWISCCMFHGISDHMFTLCYLFFQRRKTKKSSGFHEDEVVHKITERRGLVPYGALLKRHKVWWSWQGNRIWPEEIWKCCSPLAPAMYPWLN